MFKVALPKLFFPQLASVNWAKVNLNDFALQMYANDSVNPLLDPAECEKMLKELLVLLNVDYTYGGYLEDRSFLWRGSYLAKDKMIHLGVDFNVNAGTLVHSPADAILREIWHDPDQDGGWGGRVILELASGLGVILAHMDVGIIKINSLIRKGDILGSIAPSNRNGNWFPHLHVQCIESSRMNDPNFSFNNLDGYGSLDMAESFPNPDIL